MPKKLPIPTDREAQILKLIGRQIRKDGRQPTYREICRLMG